MPFKRKIKLSIPTDDEINKDGIFLGEVYVLNYYGIYVFFRVCKTFYDSVCLYEIKTKKITINNETCIALSKKLIATKEPLIIDKEQNSITKSFYEVCPMKAPYDNSEEIVLPIEVTPSSKLYIEALKNENIYPITGTCYAYRLKEFNNMCWKIENQQKEMLN